MSTNKQNPEKQIAPKKRVIRLDDLDSPEDVVGGSGGKILFGEDAAPQKSPFEDLFKPSNGRGGSSGTP
tara:strand:+ start:428 stop:634 length:207 start_codon:yes stop_codon:yes gene_type:complete